jgi:hypothetical protein
VAEALNQQNFKLNLKNVQIKLDLGKGDNNLLNGILEKNMLENKGKKR